MKTKLFIVALLLGILTFGLRAQPLYIKTQIVQFANLHAGNNYYSGDIFCFGETKVIVQLRTMSLPDRFVGNIIFDLGERSFTASVQEEDYFREVVVTLPKGKTNMSITVMPDISNTGSANASIIIFSANRGSVGSKNVLSTNQ